MMLEFKESHIIRLCQSGMALWFSIQMLRPILENELAQREKEKTYIRGYPWDTCGCRCRNCRYHRLCKKKPDQASLS